MITKNKIVEWLYINDGKFSSKNEWRKKFIEFLNNLEQQENRLELKTTKINLEDFFEELHKNGKLIINENLEERNKKEKFNSNFIGESEKRSAKELILKRKMGRI